MALSIPGVAAARKKKAVTLQAEQKAVATPKALQTLQPTTQPKAPAPTAVPSAPRETVPAAPKPAVSAGIPAGAVQTPAGQQIKAAAPTGPAMTTFSSQPPPPGAPQPLPPSSPVVAPPGGKSGDLTSVKVPPPAPTVQPPPSSGGTRDYLGEIRDAVGGKPGVKDLSSTNQPPPPSSFEEKVSQLLEQLVSGKGMNVDTSEEEALIRELMQDRTGQALVEQRARMGRAGFGASGALAAMEGDVRRQAAQQAAQETLGLRRSAQQEAIDNALRAAGVNINEKRAGFEETLNQAFLDALQSQKEANAPQEPGGGPPQEIQATIDEKGLIRGVPELAGKTFDEAVKMLYGPDANPRDYTFSPFPPFVYPMLGGEKGIIGQAGGWLYNALGFGG